MDVSLMMDLARFEDEHSLKDFLSKQLMQGRLSLVLGAGASFGFGLPSWNELISRSYRISNINNSNNKNNEVAAEYLLNTVCNTNEIAFASLIRKALYQDFKLSFDVIRKNELLSSVGAITMASRRGNISQVISFNFDDLLEVYLNYFGFDCESIETVPSWSSRADINVYHPHGLLSCKANSEIKRGIVFAQIHYDKIVGDSKNIWRQTLLNILRSNTCLFIGLSGNDNNLTNLLAEVKDTHVSKTRGDIFWGIRFSHNENDPQKEIWEYRGVYQQTLNNYSQIPRWLFEICQLAAQQFGS